MTLLNKIATLFERRAIKLDISSPSFIDPKYRDEDDYTPPPSYKELRRQKQQQQQYSYVQMVKQIGMDLEHQVMVLLIDVKMAFQHSLKERDGQHNMHKTNFEFLTEASDLVEAITDNVGEKDIRQLVKDLYRVLNALWLVDWSHYYQEEKFTDFTDRLQIFISVLRNRAPLVDMEHY